MIENFYFFFFLFERKTKIPILSKVRLKLHSAKTVLVHFCKKCSLSKK
jgi:hypothetical protein